MNTQYKNKIKKYQSKLQNTHTNSKKNIYGEKIKLYKKLLGGDNNEYDIKYMEQLKDNYDDLIEFAKNPEFWKSKLKENNYEYKYLSKDENDLRIFKTVNLKNISLIHYAALNFSLNDYRDFWIQISDYDDLWKIQLCDECREEWAGKTPLHILVENITNPSYSKFWKLMAYKTDLWKMQMSDASGKGWAGKTPLHISAEKMTGGSYYNFWLIIATNKSDTDDDIDSSIIENEDLFAIQMIDASDIGYAGKTVLHTLVTNLKHNNHLIFWLKLLSNEKLWKIQMTSSSGVGYAGKTPLHIAVENFNSLNYKESNIYNIIWCGINDDIGLSDKPDLWNMQMMEQSGGDYAGKTPLHLFLDFLDNFPKNISKDYSFQSKLEFLDELDQKYYLSDREKEERDDLIKNTIEELDLPNLDVFLKVLENLSKKENLWTIKMLDSCGKKNAGKTPLHQFIENFEKNYKKIDKYYKDTFDESNKNYFGVLLNLATKEDIWGMQLSEASGHNYSGKTPLHFAAHTLYDAKYLPFWEHVAQNFSLNTLNIEIPSSGGEYTQWKTPVNYMIEYLSSDEYNSFWIQYGKKFGSILKNNEAFKIEAPFLVKENLYALLFPNYNLMNTSLTNFDYYISSHGSMTGNFFKLPHNINLIFLTKSFTPAFVSELSKYVSGHMNTMNTTINMCQYNNILRNYDSNDIVPDINLSFFDLGNIKYIEGIISKPDMLLKTHFEDNKINQYKDIQFYSKYNKQQNIRDDVGLYKHIADKSMMKDSLFNLINSIKQKINDGSLKDKDYTIILGPCRVSRIQELKIKNLCDVVKKINKSLMEKTRYDEMCYESNISNNSDFKFEQSFASPNFEDEIRLFDQDIQYAQSLRSNTDINVTQSKLLNHELINFEEIINVYSHIVKNQKKGL
jgi:hypothetical protein